MKILYGVVGEGMGHAIRSAVVLEKLVGDGHDIHVVASGRAHAYLQARIPQISKIWGLTMVMKDNAVKNLATAAGNLRGALEGWPANVREYFEVVEKFSPDLVISDFESWSWLFAKSQRIPLICIDNIQIINRCRHEPEIIAGDDGPFRLTRSIVKAKCPRADHYLITTFFYPAVRKKRTELVPPILRQSILDATPTDAGHLLVYQTSDTFADLPAMLAELDTPVYIYGMRKDIDSDVVEGNLTYRPFSETQFVADLASCSGVVGSAGFTLMGEALHLGKPYLATPVRKQFEQSLNARYLEALGYGMYDERLDSHSLKQFIARRPNYLEALASYKSHDNSLLFEKLDELFDRREAGLL